MNIPERRFEYPMKYIVRERFPLVASLLTCVLVIGYVLATNQNAREQDTFGLIGLFGFGTAVFAYTLWLDIVTKMKIAVNDDGIATFFRNRKVREINWSSLTRIEQVRKYQSMKNRYQYFYKLIGQSSKIEFDDAITDIASLLGILTRKSQELAIPVQSIDWGEDSIRAALSKTSDRVERRKLRRHGVRSTITQLQWEAFKS